MRESEDVVLNGLPYIHAFRAFDRVVSMCFGVALKPGYEVAIQQFRTAYLDIGISVTPKVYLLRVQQKFYEFYIFLGAHSLPTHYRVPRPCQF